jgi:hypothetical protein
VPEEDCVIRSFHNLYTSPIIISVIKSRRMRWAEHVTRMEEKVNVHKIMVGKPKGKREYRKSKRRW